VQFEGYKTFGHVCGVHTVKQVLDQQLSRPEKDVATDELIFLDALKGLVVARKYMCQFDIVNSIIIICNQVKYELYSLRAGGERGGQTHFLTLSINQF
jgi:hypothetical protein